MCYTSVQASLLCTKTRAKKVIIGLTLVAVTVGVTLAHKDDLYYATYVIINVVYFAVYAVLPVTVLVINVLLIREVRRASINAAANLGVQQHHQSTSSNSAVPTVMVITTSLVYVLLRGPLSIVVMIQRFMTYTFFLDRCQLILGALSRFVFSYNFYVYLITGKQFRSDLRTLFSRSSCSLSFSAAAAARDRDDVRTVKGTDE